MTIRFSEEISIHIRTLFGVGTTDCIHCIKEHATPSRLLYQSLFMDHDTSASGSGGRRQASESVCGGARACSGWGNSSASDSPIKIYIRHGSWHRLTASQRSFSATATHLLSKLSVSALSKRGPYRDTSLSLTVLPPWRCEELKHTNLKRRDSSSTCSVSGRSLLIGAGCHEGTSSTGGREL